MVRKVNFAFYKALNGHPISGAENVVDSNIKCIGMIGDGGSVATLAEAVGKLLADNPVSIGDGTVVEVAAKDDGTALRGRRVQEAVDVGGHAIGLRCSHSGGLGKSVDEFA